MRPPSPRPPSVMREPSSTAKPDLNEQAYGFPLRARFAPQRRCAKRVGLKTRGCAERERTRRYAGDCAELEERHEPVSFAENSGIIGEEVRGARTGDERYAAPLLIANSDRHGRNTHVLDIPLGALVARAE